MENLEPEKQQDASKEKFEALLNDGRKAFILGDLNQAIDKLEEATALSVELFGDFAPETFLPHHYYGKSLLEQVIAESELLESKEITEESIQDDPILGSIKKQDEEVDANQTLNNEEVVEEEEDENVENSQLAFESLEYARIVCEKNLLSENCLLWLERQKDTLVLLGSLALNDDQFEQSIQDFSKALQIANEFFADQYREIAFINMELARVQRKAKNYAEACAYFDKATQAIQEYKKKLESEPQTDGGKLIAEIDEILDDISGEKALVKHYETDKENASTSKPQSSVVEVKPIDSLLIKRKETRHVNDTEESAAKKTKMDN